MSVHYKPIPISLRSRLWIRMFRLLLKPMMRWMIRGSFESIARQQVRLAGTACRDTAGLAQSYQIINGVPGLAVGDVSDRSRPVLLWLHGGAFILPAVPAVHLRLLALLCKELGAVGFLPDYRLAPFNRFPASLDDCERAYAGVIELGFDPARVALCGDSAGGNLALGALQRIRKRGLPMPACALLLSPVTEMGRVHSPPSRHQRARADAILPIASLQRVDELYAGDWDASDPELSPLYADYRGFPPLHFLCGDAEVLRDDSILATERANHAGVEARCDVWPLLPHAFPLFERLFPETAEARADMLRFLQRHLHARSDSAAVTQAGEGPIAPAVAMTAAI